MLNAALGMQPSDTEALFSKGVFLQNERGDVSGAQNLFEEVCFFDF